MPPRHQLCGFAAFAAVVCAAVSAAPQEPSSGYRLRPERGQSRVLHVAAPAEEPRTAMASLSDDEPESEAEPPRETVAPTTYAQPAIESPISAMPAGGDKPPLKLAPRSETGGRQLAKPTSLNPTGAVGSVVGSLAIVLGLFVVVVWVSRRFGPAGSTPLPKEAVELLGRTTVGNQHTLQLVRVGGRLLLVALSAHGAATLTEINDPDEVERLTALCLRQRPGSSTATFQQTISELERQPASRSFVEQRRPTAAASARPPRTTSRA